GEVLSLIGPTADVGLVDALGVGVGDLGVALLLGDGDCVVEEGALADAAVLLEPPVLARLLPQLALGTDVDAVTRVPVVAVEAEHRWVLVVAVVQREPEVGDPLAVRVSRRPGSRLTVVAEEGEDLVLLDKLLGAGQVA